MPGPLTSSAVTDPLHVLGLPPGASEEAIRHRYLQLVRQFPPDRDPVRFGEIYAAYQAANDPLRRAESLLEFKLSEAPPWEKIVEEFRSKRPRLDVDSLLSLGNRSSLDDASTNSSDCSD